MVGPVLLPNSVSIKEKKIIGTELDNFVKIFLLKKCPQRNGYQERLNVISVFPKSPCKIREFRLHLISRQVSLDQICWIYRKGKYNNQCSQFVINTNDMKKTNQKNKWPSWKNNKIEIAYISITKTDQFKCVPLKFLVWSSTGRYKALVNYYWQRPHDKILNSWCWQSWLFTNFYSL